MRSFCSLLIQFSLSQERFDFGVGRGSMRSNEAGATARSMSSWGHVEHGPAFIKVQWPVCKLQMLV
jgi:hypothetical protein